MKVKEFGTRGLYKTKLIISVDPFRLRSYRTEIESDELVCFLRTKLSGNNNNTK